MAQRHDAIHDPHVRADCITSQCGADPLRELAAQSVQLFVATQLDPELDVVAIVVSGEPAYGNLVGAHPKRGADFAADRSAYLRQPLGSAEIVDEDHRRPMVASPPHDYLAGVAIA